MEEITAAEVHPEAEQDDLESALTAKAEQATGHAGNTIVAWALVS
jgi:hypothetical protein